MPASSEEEVASKSRLSFHGDSGQSTSNDRDLGQLSNKAREFKNTTRNAELDISDNPQIHQRSRSNEIDYTSIGYESRVRIISAFRSPPGTMLRGFRPQSVDSAHGSLFSDITDSLTSTGTSMHATNTNAAVSTTNKQGSNDRNLCSSSSESTVTELETEGMVESATGQASSAAAMVGRETDSDGKQQLTLDWLKDFDPGLISDYFSSSDEPRLKVVD